MLHRLCSEVDVKVFLWCLGCGVGFLSGMAPVRCWTGVHVAITIIDFKYSRDSDITASRAQIATSTPPTNPVI